MNIYEAMEAADVLHPCITRKAWTDGLITESPGLPRIYPTNTPDGCFYNAADGICRPWVPTKADLLADDWRIIDFFGRDPLSD